MRAHHNAASYWLRLELSKKDAVAADPADAPHTHSAAMSQQPTSQSLARDACIVAAARIARERGFAAADEGALEALADVVRASVRALSAARAANARHATRSDLALNDVLSALKQSPIEPGRVAGAAGLLLPARGPRLAPARDAGLDAAGAEALEPLRRLGCGRDDDAARARARVPPALPREGLAADAPAEEAQARRRGRRARRGGAPARAEPHREPAAARGRRRLAAPGAARPGEGERATSVSRRWACRGVKPIRRLAARPAAPANTARRARAATGLRVEAVREPRLFGPRPVPDEGAVPQARPSKSVGFFQPRPSQFHL